MNKILLYIFTIFLLTGCAKVTPQWQYVHKIPIERSGNSYVANYNGRIVTFIKVSDTFSFSEQQYNKGLLLDIFVPPSDDFPAVYVINRFGVFKAKNELNIALNNSYIVHESSAKINQRHYTIVQKIGDHDVIGFFILHADASDGGYINSTSIYMDYLPHYYAFESWNPQVLEERQDFISKFEKSAKDAILYNPRK